MTREELKTAILPLCKELFARKYIKCDITAEEFADFITTEECLNYINKNFQNLFVFTFANGSKADYVMKELMISELEYGQPNGLIPKIIPKQVCKLSTGVAVCVGGAKSGYFRHNYQTYLSKEGEIFIIREYCYSYSSLELDNPDFIVRELIPNGLDFVSVDIMDKFLPEKYRGFWV